jgi:capsular polysaccharide biosynthesis protein
MRVTWSEAQAALARQAMSVTLPPAEPVAPMWPTASDRTCPHCGKLCMHAQALKWHLRGCEARPKPEATV